MTVLDLPISAGGFFGTQTDRGVSTDASRVRNQLISVLRAFYDTWYIRHVHQEAHEALREAATEAGSPNWDGYGAQPVQAQAIVNATRFLRSLPSTVPNPDVAVDPDGEVSFEWSSGPARAFSVSVGNGDIVTFAGINGRKKIHGTDLLIDEPPSTLLQHLGRTILE